MSETPRAETHPPAEPSLDALTPEQAAAEERYIDAGERHTPVVERAVREYLAATTDAERARCADHLRVLDDFNQAFEDFAVFYEVLGASNGEPTAEVATTRGLESPTAAVSPTAGKSSRTQALIQTRTAQTQANQERGA